MKKILLITGTQNRHLAVASQLSSYYHCDWITYARKLVPQEGFSDLNKENCIFFEQHLNQLRVDEEDLIGHFSESKIKDSNQHNIDRFYSVSSRDELNSDGAHDFIRQSQYQCAVVYGSGIISNETLNAINCRVVNIHGGISPYFKGSSTLLYALLMCQPELVGFTLHDIDSGIDSGDIYAHIIPSDISLTSSPTQLFATAQLELCSQINAIIELIINGKLKPTKQSPYGRVFMERDFRIEMLRQVYNYYQTGLLESALRNLSVNRSKYKLLTIDL